MSKYYINNNMTKKACHAFNICYKCGGHLKQIKTKNGKYLYMAKCELCSAIYYGKDVNGNLKNPNFKKKKQKKRKRWNKESYAKYLNSPHWFKFKRAYYRKHQKICKKCGSRLDIQLHHLTYKRIGEEKFEDVIPLCRKCHAAIHNK